MWIIHDVDFYTVQAMQFVEVRVDSSKAFQEYKGKETIDLIYYRLLHHQNIKKTKYNK